MKTFFLFAVSVACFFSPLLWRRAGGEAFAQDNSDKQNMQVTTRDAFYPKGEQALYTYILYNVKYSEESKQKYIEGDISLSFEVMPDSTIRNVRIISDVGYGVGEEVKKLLEKLKFAPAVQMGIPVKMSLMMDFPVKAH